MPSKLPLVLIIGPTAVGKTEIAIQLAERLNGEIVSADSRLLYRGMDIGTAKPTPEERKRVQHHLIDIAEPDEILSLAVFQQKARSLITDIHSRGKLPFLVGGTGQYIHAVTRGWKPPEVIPNERLRKELEKLALSHSEGVGKERGQQWLHARLEFLDPDAAAGIDARNMRRIIRALEVIFTTGRKFSEQRRQSESPYRLITIGLTRPRPELYARIDARIDSMFASGFLDEVKSLLAKGCSPALPSMSAIGYRECVEALEGRITVEEAKQAIRRATRIFVRRQANWFKESNANIQWFRPSVGVEEEIEKFIRKMIDF